jgi:predicted nucleotidyltransferase
VEELGLTGSSQARVEAAQAKELETGLTEQDKRANVVRLAFQGDEERLKEFVEIIRSAIPPDTGVVLRGSAVTGRRWKDGALFDCEGPGTSDLDLTLVGDAVIALYKVTGFFLPGIHSRPISKDDPDIAPALVPLRERLMDMVGRPVNIQATRDFVMYVRGELLGQPYLVLIEKPNEAERA